MSRQTWEELWADDKGAASLGLQNTFTTAKSVINGPVHGLPSIPGNYMVPGSKFKFTAYGATSNIVTTPGTITFQMMAGAVIACTSGAINLVTTAQTLAAAKIECLMQCTAIGNGTQGKFEGIWTANGASFAGAASQTVGGIATAPASPAAGTGFDSTSAQNIDFFTAFSISNAGNGIRIDFWTFESWN